IEGRIGRLRLQKRGLATAVERIKSFQEKLGASENAEQVKKEAARKARELWRSRIRETIGDTQDQTTIRGLREKLDSVSHALPSLLLEERKERNQLVRHLYRLLLQKEAEL